MKTKLTLLPLCLFALTSYAQLWSPEGAKWHHFFFSTDPFITNNNGYMTTKYDRDTLINGESCKLLLQILNDVDLYDTLFTKEMDSVVYIYNKQTTVFDTLFNFKSSIGASWKIPGYGFSGCGNQGRVTVANKGYRNINGFNLLWMKVDVQFDPLDNFGLWDYSDTIFQRFGTNRYYFMPYSHCEFNCELESIDGFRCYEDKDFSNLNLFNFDCDYIQPVGIIPIEDQYFSIYNDSKYLKVICSENSKNQHIEIKLMDMSGQVYFSKNEFSFKEETISIEQLPRGTYIVTINKFYKKKVIII